MISRNTNIINKTIACSIACVFLFSDIAYGADLRTPLSYATLAPVSGFKPMVSLSWDAANNKYLIIEDGNGAAAEFRQESVVIYLGQIIWQFMDGLAELSGLGVTDTGLEQFKKERLEKLVTSIKNDLPCVDLEKYRLYWDGDALCLELQEVNGNDASTIGDKKISRFYLPGREPSHDRQGFSEIKIENEMCRQKDSNLLLRTDFMDQLADDDRDMLNRIITSDSEQLRELIKNPENGVCIACYEIYDKTEKNTDGQTVYYALKVPVTIDNKKITTIRLKGIRPWVDSGDVPAGDKKTTVRPYDYGHGFVAKAPMIDDDGNIRFKEQRLKPNGSMRYDDALKELEIMENCSGRVRTDLALGIGEYTRLEFDGVKVGYVVAGIEGHDDRFTESGGLIYRVRNDSVTGDSKELKGDVEEILKNVGRTLREYNDMGYCHRYPYIGNIGLAATDNGDVAVMRDLCTTVPIRPEHSPYKKVGLRFLDILMVLRDLPLKEKYIRPLLTGYFHDISPESSAFARMLETCMAKDKFHAGRMRVYAEKDYMELDPEEVHFGNIIANLYKIEGIQIIDEAVDEYDPEHEKRTAEDFRNAIIARAQEARQDGRKIILGFVEDWMPDNKYGSQAILQELSRLPENLKRRGLDNVIFEHGDKERIADTVKKEMEGTRTKFSDVIILGGRDIFGAKMFSAFRGETDEDSALLIGIDPAELGDTTGIRLLEMFFLALCINSGVLPETLDTEFVEITKDPSGNSRAFIFKPVKPYDLETVREINELQRKEIDVKA